MHPIAQTKQRPSKVEVQPMDSLAPEGRVLSSHSPRVPTNRAMIINEKFKYL